MPDDDRGAHGFDRCEEQELGKSRIAGYTLGWGIRAIIASVSEFARSLVNTAVRHSH